MGSVLVTGAGGFVGGHLLRSFGAHGAPVRALTRRPAADAPAGATEHVTADLRDPSALVAAMAGVDTVYHLAGVVPARGLDEMRTGNATGTRNVAAACVRAGVARLVVVSSVAVYRPPLGDVVDETAPTGGAEPYGRSKSEAEAAVRAVAGDRIEWVVVRPCQIYGPGDTSGFTGRLLSLCGAPVLPVAGWAGRGFSIVHVDDVVAALRAAGTARGVAGGVFNVAPVSRVTLPELARIRAAILGRLAGVRLPLPACVLRAGLALRAASGGHADSACSAWRAYAGRCTHGSLLLGGPRYDTRRARTRLGFAAATTPEAGLAQLLAPSPSSPGDGEGVIDR